VNRVRDAVAVVCGAWLAERRIFSEAL